MPEQYIQSNSILIVLLMKDSPNSTHKKNEGNHDGCDDCIKQKKQNELFIQIYEKLQEVDKKTARMRQAVTQHKHICDTNQSFYKSYEQKLTSLPKMKDVAISPRSMEYVGYEIATNILQKQAKSKVIQENNRLKQILYRMQRQKYMQKKGQVKISKMERVNNQIEKDDKTTTKQKDESMNNSSLSLESKECQESSYQKWMHSQQTSSSLMDNSSTQSSSFDIPQMRNSVNLNKYNDLNLWLYESEKNAKLQSQLYLVKEVTNRSFITPRNKSILPSIRKKKGKFV